MLLLSGSSDTALMYVERINDTLPHVYVEGTDTITTFASDELQLSLASPVEIDCSPGDTFTIFWECLSKIDMDTQFTKLPIHMQNTVDIDSLDEVSIKHPYNKDLLFFGKVSPRFFYRVQIYNLCSF